MVYAAFSNGNERKQGIYSYEELFSETFSPESVIFFVTNFVVHTKEEARGLAMEIMDFDRETVDAGGEELSWNEWNIIGSKLERIARRFGLVREFRENGII